MHTQVVQALTPEARSPTRGCRKRASHDHFHLSKTKLESKRGTHDGNQGNWLESDHHTKRTDVKHDHSPDAARPTTSPSTEGILSNISKHKLETTRILPPSGDIPSERIGDLFVGNKRKYGEACSGNGSLGGGEESDLDRTKKRQHEFSIKDVKRTEKFACPYYKRYPQKYKDWRSCPGPGWSEVHRVKEHLYRRHRQWRYKCPRCLEAFQNKLELDSHIRAELLCPIADSHAVLDGFDETIAAKLQSRRGQQYLDEASRWYEVYKILFPGSELPSSPYYEHPNTPSRPETVTQTVQKQALYTFKDMLERDRHSLRGSMSEALKQALDLGKSYDAMEKQISHIVQNYLSDNLRRVSNGDVTSLHILDTASDGRSQNPAKGPGPSSSEVSVPTSDGQCSSYSDATWMLTGTGTFTDDLQAASGDDFTFFTDF